MKKRALAFVLMIMLIFSSVPIVSATDSIQGSGTKSDPYIIDNLNQFYAFLNQSENTSATKTYYSLGSDISAQDNTPIGGRTAQNISLDGNNHKISGFSVTNALFKSVSNSEIRNIVFDDISVSADENSEQGDIYLAVVAAQTESSTVISNVTVDHSVIKIPASDNNVYSAVIAGQNGSKIINCIVESGCVFEAEPQNDSYTSQNYIGSITAENGSRGSVVNCISKAGYSLNSSAAYTIGGIAAINSAAVKYCCTISQSPFDEETTYDNRKFYSVTFNDSNKCDNTGSVYLENGIWYIMNKISSAEVEIKNIYELAAQMSENVASAYNQICYESGLISNEADYACPWTVENEQLSLSYDGKTAVTYFYVDSSLSVAEITFTDPNYIVVTDGVKYIVSAGRYDGGEYIRHEFALELFYEGYKSINNFILEPTQKYINSLTNTLDGAGGTYSSQTQISAKRPQDDELRLNTASYRLYPFCTKLSLPANEIIPYDFNGSGTSESPYEISNAYELNCLSYSVNNYPDIYSTAHYILTADVEMNGEFTPIGTVNNEFKGSFDGQLHTVSNLTVNSKRNYQGMFSKVTGVKDSDNNYTNAVIKNLILSNVTISGKSADNKYTDLNGCLVGEAVHTTISNCITSGTASGDTLLGGIVGYSYYSEINNCASTAALNTYGGNTQAGGIAGYAEHSSIRNCYGAAQFVLYNVTDTEQPNVGGIAGYYKKTPATNGGSNNTVNNCYYLSGTQRLVNTTEGEKKLQDKEAVEKTAEQFRNGEVAYLLNNAVTDGTQTWYQDIDNGKYTPQDYPVFGNNGYNTVYCYSVNFMEKYTNNQHKIAFDVDKDGNFIISNYDELCNMSYFINLGVTEYTFGSYIVVNDIVCPDNEVFTPIGTYMSPFAGTFEGGGYTISNLNVTADDSYKGLFGYVQGATIRNISLNGKIKCEKDGIREIGGIVGGATCGTTNKGELINVVLRNVRSDVEITNSDGKAVSYVGGIIGKASNVTTIDRCVFSGNISLSDSDCIGGIIGEGGSLVEISNSANIGTVTSTKQDARTGGILGYVNQADFEGLKNCYNYGKVTGSGNNIGAIVGCANDSTSFTYMLNNYYLTDSCANAFGTAGNSGTAESKSAEQFASGEVAYLLNSSVTDGTQAWYQNLDNGFKPDIYPDVVNNNQNTVYKVDLSDKTYSNFEDGIFDIFDVDEDGNFIIRTYEDLCNMSSLVSGGQERFTKGKYIVVNDIACPDNAVFKPIGSSSTPFMGVFNGGGFTISNLNIVANSSHQGLFGYVSGATVKDFTVGGKIKCAKTYISEIGGAVGYATNGAVLTDINSEVAITNIEGTTIIHVGGVVGSAVNSSTVERSIFSGSITLTASNDCIGGIVGYSNKNVKILNCANLGTLVVKNPLDGALLGGILGYINNSGFAGLENCYNYGKISSSGSNENHSYVGAIVGWARDDSSYKVMLNNYYLDASFTSGFGTGGNSGTATSKTKKQFASGEVAYLLNSSVTDGSQTWYQNIDNGLTPDDYPVLANNGTNTVYKVELRGDLKDKTYSNFEYGSSVPFDVDINGSFIIRTYDDLCNMSTLVNLRNEKYTKGSYIVVNDIDCPENEVFTPIGSNSALFMGKFNGGGHTISNLNINANTNYQGLFGCVSGAELKNFTVDGNINGINEVRYIGGVAGYAESGSTLTGINSSFTITDINGKKLHNVGGIVGYIDGQSTIDRCMFSGRIALTESQEKIGGIAGCVNGEAKITNCANVGSVCQYKLSAYIGGIVGCIDSYNLLGLENCYNYGTVSNNGPAYNVGAVVGYVIYDSAAEKILNNYYLDSSSQFAFGQVSREGTAIEMTAEQFASGEVAYLLNSKVTDGTQAWYQNLDNGLTPDSYPLLVNSNKNTVYKVDLVGKTYSNYDVEKVPSAIQQSELRTYLRIEGFRGDYTTNIIYGYGSVDEETKTITAYATVTTETITEKIGILMHQGNNGAKGIMELLGDYPKTEETSAYFISNKIAEDNIYTDGNGCIFITIPDDRSTVTVKVRYTQNNTTTTAYAPTEYTLNIVTTTINPQRLTGASLKNKLDKSDPDYELWSGLVAAINSVKNNQTDDKTDVPKDNENVSTDDNNNVETTNAPASSTSDEVSKETSVSDNGLVQTGDAMNGFFFLGVMLAALALAFIYRRKYNK